VSEVIASTSHQRDICYQRHSTEVKDSHLSCFKDSIPFQLTHRHQGQYPVPVYQGQQLILFQFIKDNNLCSVPACFCLQGQLHSPPLFLPAWSEKLTHCTGSRCVRAKSPIAPCPLLIDRLLYIFGYQNCAKRDVAVVPNFGIQFYLSYISCTPCT